MPPFRHFQRTALLIAALFGCDNLPAHGASPTQTSQQITKLAHYTQSFWFTRRARSYDINVSYPRVIGVANAAKLNRLIKRVVLEKIGTYCGQDFGTWKKGTPRGHLVGNYQMLCANPHALSMRFNFSTYYPDAATSSDEIKCLNLDPETGEVLTIESLFKEGTDYPKVLSVLALHQLINAGDGSELASIPGAIEADERNFQDFSLSANDLMIFYHEADFEPEAHDIRRIDLPLSRLRGLLSERFTNQLLSNAAFVPTDLPRLDASTLKTQLAQLSIGSLSVMIANHPDAAELYELRAKYYQELGRNEPADSDLARARSLNADAATSNSAKNDSSLTHSSPEPEM